MYAFIFCFGRLGGKVTVGFWGIIVRFAQFEFSHDVAELKLGAGDKVPLARRWFLRLGRW